MTTDPHALRRYLLGTASDSERDAIEQAYFEGDTARQAVEDAEDSLIESYLDGTLTADERVAFERAYLASPLHRRRVDIARRLRAAARRDHRPAAWWRYGLAAAAVIAIALGGLLWSTRGSMQPPADVPVVAEAPPLPPATPPPAPRPPIVVALAVPPVTVRGPGGPPTVLVPAEAERLALTLEMEPGRQAPARPQVIVETVEGNEAWRGDAIIQDAVQVSVPVDRLPPGDYIARVIDTARGDRSEAGQYFFRVERAP